MPEYEQEIVLVSLPCKQCSRPVEVTKEKADEYEAKNDLPLCLEHAILNNPEKF